MTFGAQVESSLKEILVLSINGDQPRVPFIPYFGAQPKVWTMIELPPEMHMGATPISRLVRISGLKKNSCHGFKFLPKRLRM
jgi:hypothetical protein|uniref:Uncharacterized protein n=1 Tax=Picea glauca TaxID=3330 RepID=A0A101M4U5_PICGL|nr:hypothetical protein ABT39_MTgene871 [Picea glauca]QHR89372.1 hypothetical protein Q903MT_gene3393 [Picea sitchensis]